MKRFFFVFTIVMVVFLLLMAGALAAAQYGAIKPESKSYPFLGGWGVTLIPYQGSTIIYPDGDVFLIRRAGAQGAAPGDVVLYAGGSDWFVKSGLIESKTDSGFRITASDGATTDEPAGSVQGVYRSRIPYLGTLIDEMKQPLALGVYAGVLIASIVLWKLLPGGRRRKTDALSESDEDIATILY